MTDQRISLSKITAFYARHRSAFLVLDAVAWTVIAYCLWVAYV